MMYSKEVRDFVREQRGELIRLDYLHLMDLKKVREKAARMTTCYFGEVGFSYELFAFLRQGSLRVCTAVRGPKGIEAYIPMDAAGDCTIELKVPCKVDTHNWYWNKKFQEYLAKQGFRWPFKKPGELFNVRGRRYLSIQTNKRGSLIFWMTKKDFEESDLTAYNAKKFMNCIASSNEDGS